MGRAPQFFEATLRRCRDLPLNDRRTTGRARVPAGRRVAPGRDQADKGVWGAVSSLWGRRAWPGIPGARLNGRNRLVSRENPQRSIPAHGLRMEYGTGGSLMDWVVTWGS